MSLAVPWLPISAALVLMAVSANAGTIIYQDNFGGDGVATNTGIGGGLNRYERQGGPWTDDGKPDGLDSNRGAFNHRGNVTSQNKFDLKGGFKLTVSYTISNVEPQDGYANRAQFGLLDAAYLPANQNSRNYITDYLNRDLNKYGIGLNLTTQDGTQGLNFADGTNLERLSNAQTITTGTHTAVLEVDDAGNWSYSIDGATPTSGKSTFDVDRVYHFHAFVQDDKNDLIINSVTLEVLREPSSFAPLREAESIQRLGNEFLDWKFGMFIHFNVATFHNVQWASGYEDPASFSPDKLDCDQWARSAVAAGMKYAVLTVKHTGGWCLWDSKLTETHAMPAFVNYKDGKGDIVREFVDACRRHDLKVGLYYCFPRNFGHPKGEKPLNGLPPEAAGDPVSFVKKQLTELLTNYGQIDLLWCDQYQFNIRKHWPNIIRHVKSHQPDCIVIANNSLDFKDTDIHSYEHGWLKARRRPSLPPEGNTTPSEVCDPLGPGWFWMADRPWKLKSAQQVADMLRLCNDRKANHLLNVSPDRSGLIPPPTVERLREIGGLLGVKSR